jgi:hypothetical protein
MDISGIMNLREKKEVFSQLPVGSAIVKLSERYVEPFLVEVSPVEQRNHVFSDVNVSARMKSLVMGVEVEKGHDEQFRKQIEAPKLIVEQVLDEEHSQAREITLLEPTHKLTQSYLSNLAFREHCSEQVQGSRLKLIQGRKKLVSATQNEFINDKISAEIPEKPFIIKKETKNKKTGLTEKQKILYDFVVSQTAKGKDLIEIEKVMRTFRDDSYEEIDILKVMNFAFANLFKIEVGEVVTTPKETFKKKLVVQTQSKLTEEQEKFILFLRTNPEHEDATVAIYKKVGLSARKGTKVKNELLSLGLIKVQEKKNAKGWKKIITLI